jgi:hypothetical protein
MKKIFFTLFAGVALLLTGCFESTQEITLNEDGSGTVSNTNDMSALLGMAKQMGGGSELEKMTDQKIDSTFSLAEGADSIPNLSPEERAIAKKGSVNITMNLKDEKFSTSLKFPFSSPSEISAFNKISGKIMAETMKEQMSNAAGAGGQQLGSDDEMPAPTSFDDYYTMSFSNGVLTKTLNKEKYAVVADDQYLKSLKEAAGMGLAMKANYIINLPHPASKAEGKGVTLSENKKQVKVSADIDDFFDDPSKLEFRIEY